jgi:hypothetical protein
MIEFGKSFKQNGLIGQEREVKCIFLLKIKFQSEALLILMKNSKPSKIISLK